MKITKNYLKDFATRCTKKKHEFKIKTHYILDECAKLSFF